MTTRPHADTPFETVDVLVVGAGQAALALGHALRHRPYTFRIVDGNSRIGDSWRHRYDSLTLFTPRAYSALPGLAVPGDPEGYPTKDEIADYLEAYAARFELPVLLETGIASLRRTADRFRATTSDGRVFESRAVVLANGAFQEPAIPPLAIDLSSEVFQISARDYRRPAQVPGGTVVVVGDGATGRQIAVELARTHRVFLSSGRPRRVSRERLLGKSIFWWMEKTGLLTASRESAVGRRLRSADPFPGRDLDRKGLTRRGVVVVPRLRAAAGDRLTFEDGRQLSPVAAVVWATGYREDTAWVEIPEAKNARRDLVHHRGLTPVPGLYLLGRSWQWTRGSALITGVGDDARFLADHITERLGSGPRAPGAPLRTDRLA